MKSLFSLLGCAALTLAAFETRVSATVVFDNSVTDSSKNFVVPNNVEVGDQIQTVNIGSSIITNFNFQYFLTGTTGGSEQLRVRFYANNGPVGTAGIATPGTMLFDSAFFIIAPTPRSVLTFDASVGAPFPLTVPNNFTWTVEFGNVLAGGSAGVTLYNPPSVGRDSAEYWDKTGGTWTLKQSQDGSAINFGAQVQAVPEPGTFAMIGMAGLGLVAARRFRKN